jgi:hypothetical protein
MKKTLALVATAAAITFATPAAAQVALDLKLGYAIPTGNAASGADVTAAMSDAWSGALPIGVGARYRFTPNISAGLYFQFAPAFVASSLCDAGVSCSGYDMRLGIEAVYGFMPDASWNPWVSLGTGWEWIQLKASGGGESASTTFSGWEYFNVQAGVDFPLSRAFALGPYLGYFGGTYTNVSVSSSLVNDSQSIPSANRSFHGWFQFGVKGTLSL